MSDSNMSDPKAPAPEAPAPMAPERRRGPADRRTQRQDRRDVERVADDLVPRRNPDLPDRRGGGAIDAPARPAGDPADR